MRQFEIYGADCAFSTLKAWKMLEFVPTKRSFNLHSFLIDRSIFSICSTNGHGNFHLSNCPTWGDGFNANEWGREYSMNINSYNIREFMIFPGDVLWKRMWTPFAQKSLHQLSVRLSRRLSLIFQLMALEEFCRRVRFAAAPRFFYSDVWLAPRH